MSNSIILADSGNGLTVDFTDSASISRKGSNTGLINIPIPADYSWDGKGGAFLINLRMVSDIITIKFTFRDGIGTHFVSTVVTSEAANLADMVSRNSTLTKYEKLWYLFKHVTGNKWLFWGATENSTSNMGRFSVQIQDVDFTIDGGAKDIITGSISLVVGVPDT